MADKDRSSRKRKRARRREADKNKDFTSKVAETTRPNSQVIVGSSSSDGRKFQRVSGSSSFLDKMRARLSGGHFRMINEKLYTCTFSINRHLKQNSTGGEALDYFKEDQVLFDVYHTGYQEQMSHWPERPVNLIIKWLKEHDPSSIVADFGCGDACLAKNVKNKVFSFDLVSKDPSVIACDMSNTPLDSSSVDVAVFCLSLMGVNYASYLVEAQRVLKPRGWLLISEVKSRFDPSNGGADPKKFIKAVCELGFVSALKDFSNKMFTLLYFKKKDEKISKGKDIDWPELKPCLYKRR